MPEDHPQAAGLAERQRLGGLSFDAYGNLFRTTEFGGDANSDSTVFEITSSRYQVACLCRGTRILTPSGEVPVEALEVGDLVITLSGVAGPIRWIRRRSYAGRLLSGRRELLPVLIQAGALGEGLPRRNLRVSLLHAMFLEGGADCG